MNTFVCQAAGHCTWRESAGGERRSVHHTDVKARMEGEGNYIYACPGHSPTATTTGAGESQEVSGEKDAVTPGVFCLGDPRMSTPSLLGSSWM